MDSESINLGPNPSPAAMYRNIYYGLRHGEAQSTIQNINDSYGDPDNYLTEKGKEQIIITAHKLKDSNILFDVIISSPFPRAKETAQIVGGILNLKSNIIQLDDRLKEMNHGSEQCGKLIKPAVVTLQSYEEMHLKHGDGESYWDVRDRVVALLKDLEKNYQNKIILLVTHGTPLWMLVSVVENFNETETIRWRNQHKNTTGFFISEGEFFKLT